MNICVEFQIEHLSEPIKNRFIFIILETGAILVKYVVIVSPGITTKFARLWLKLHAFWITEYFWYFLFLFSRAVFILRRFKRTALRCYTGCNRNVDNKPWTRRKTSLQRLKWRAWHQLCAKTSQLQSLEKGWIF